MSINTLQPFTTLDYKQLYDQLLLQVNEHRDIIIRQQEVIEQLSQTSQQEQINFLKKYSNQLEAVVASQGETIDSQQRLIIDLQKQLEKLPLLQHEIGQLKRMIYGSKSERFVPTEVVTAQLALTINAEAVAACSVTEARKIAYTRASINIEKKPLEHPGRQALPAHLRRVTEVIEPENTPAGAEKIGEEVTERMEYQEPELYVVQTIRPKYKIPATGTADIKIIIGDLPAQPIDKCIAGPSLLAHLVVEKYLYHLPIYRQVQRLAQYGVQVPYSTATDWINRTGDLLIALHQALIKEIMESGYIHADETPLKVLDKEKAGGKKSHIGYLWSYSNSIKKLVCFDYRQGRGTKHALDMLSSYQGYLQTDGWHIYDRFGKRPGVTHLGCMAHARRKFDEAKDNDLKRSEYALGEFAQLYAIERYCRIQEMSFEERKKEREEKAVPILNNLNAWMKAELVHTTPKSPIGKALAYSLQRWEKLCRYTENGMLSIDNNNIENAIRPIAIGRKNYLFAGSHDAAQRAAVIYSLVGTCKMHNIDPYAWLKDVLSKIATYPAKNLLDLLPHNWKATIE